MATLWKRATPSQYRMLRAIAGAVVNAAHAHQIELPKHFSRSIAKRATGTLTAGWPDVLAAKQSRSQKASERRDFHSRRRRSDPFEGQPKGDRHTVLRRSPIRALWKRYAARMWAIKRNGTPEQYSAYIRVLQLLAQAERELAALGE